MTGRLSYSRAELAAMLVLGFASSIAAICLPVDSAPLQASTERKDGYFHVTIRNVGSKPRRVQRVVPSCDCLEISPSVHGPWVLAPGASFSVQVQRRLGVPFNTDPGLIIVLDGGSRSFIPIAVSSADR